MNPVVHDKIYNFKKGNQSVNHCFNIKCASLPFQSSISRLLQLIMCHNYSCLFSIGLEIIIHIRTVQIIHHFTILFMGY